MFVISSSISHPVSPRSRGSGNILLAASIADAYLLRYIARMWVPLRVYVCECVLFTWWDHLCLITRHHISCSCVICSWNRARERESIPTRIFERATMQIQWVGWVLFRSKYEDKITHFITSALCTIPLHMRQITKTHSHSNLCKRRRTVQRTQYQSNIRVYAPPHSGGGGGTLS